MSKPVEAWAVVMSSGLVVDLLYSEEQGKERHARCAQNAPLAEPRLVHLREVVTCSACSHYSRDSDCPTAQQWCDAYNVAVYPMMSCPDWTGADGERA